MLLHWLGAIEVMGSNPGKGEAFLNYLNLMLTKKVPILTHDVDVSPYYKGYNVNAPLIELKASFWGFLRT